MSDGLKGVDALRRALRANTEEARTTAARTVREADEVAAEKRRLAEQAAADAEDAAIAARRLEQESLDAQSAQDEKLRGIDHRAGNQTYILTGARPDVPAAEVPEPPLLTHDDEPPAAPPVQSPASPVPQPEPIRTWVFTREQWFQWMNAIIGAVVGIVFARLFAGSLAGWLVPFHNGWTTFVAFLLWVAFVLGGFAISGFIGLWLLLYRRRH